ncbi:MAG: hypothetical protein VX792_14355, partial [Candidatus Latescibacterota bacterium]|nr:hypothetical protein [Candidatus Latescibacterota bacterium]
IFFFEVAAIVVGLTISFLIDEWRQERKIQQEEVRILKSINEDLETDRQRAVEKIEFCEIDLLTFEKLIDPTITSTVSVDTLNFWINKLIRFNGFMAGDHTYKNIDAEMRTTLGNSDLRKDLQNYYSYIYGLAHDWEDLEKQLAERRRIYLQEEIRSDGIYMNETMFGNFSVPSYEQQDINKALNDPYFHSLVRWTIFAYTGTRAFALQRIDKIEEVKTQLKIALEDLE